MKETLSHPINAIVKIFGKNEGDSGRQFGGPVSYGSSYAVGEHRPEVFVPSQSGNIKQLGQTGGGSIVVNFNNPSVRNDNDLQAIIDAVDRIIYITPKKIYSISKLTALEKGWKCNFKGEDKLIVPLKFWEIK